MHYKLLISGIFLEKYKNKNFQICNISNDLESFDWVTRNTIQWFEDGNTCDLAIIEISHLNRYEYIDEHKKRFSFNIGSKDPYINRMSVGYNNTIHNEQNGLYYWNYNEFLLQTYFKNKNINHIFLKFGGGIPKRKWFDLDNNTIKLDHFDKKIVEEIIENKINEL